ncbi:MAG: glycosyltransferase family 4 protein [Thermodesulfobacteriota bacterium]
MLAFVVNQFPRQVDAYFLRELIGLHESGLDFAIYSLLAAPRGWKVHADAQPLLERVVYPPPLPRLAGRAARVALSRPAVTTATVAGIAWGHRSMPAALAKSLAIVPQALAFARDMRERGVRHIHANWATYPGTAALLISRLTGIPYSFSGHATDIFVHHAMLREKIDAARFVVTCTDYNRGYLARVAPERADSIRTIYHGVDLERFARNGTARVPTRVLTVGTLRTCKGIDDLIRAVGILRDRGRHVELEVVGDGEERSALESLTRSLGLEDRVFMRGYLPQEEVIPAYHRAAVVALPAHHEDHFGIPNILIEGLAAGTPVVCTELPSLGELVEHGRSGLFVPERDPQALADAIARLLDDPAAAARMAEEGRRRVAEKFDMRQTVAELAGALRAAAEGRA